MSRYKFHANVRAWCGPHAGSKTEAAEPASLSRSPTDCDTCGNLCRRGVGVFDTPTSVREVCQKQTHFPNHEETSPSGRNATKDL